MSGIDALLASLPAWVLVGGKGGVGKTTCAAALAVASARRGDRTLVLSTDPAGTLADTLGIPLGGEPSAVPSSDALWASQLDATTARSNFLDRWGPVLATIIDRGTYLDRDDIQGLVDATLPGVDETMALLALADLADGNEWDRVILDTAPTGHTLRLLALPETFRALIDLLDTMQAKHRFMVSALMHRYRPDDADAFIAALRGKLQRLHALTTDSARMSVVLVSRPEPVVIAETLRYAESLAEMNMTVTAIVLNAMSSGMTDDTSLDGVRRAMPDADMFTVPFLHTLVPGSTGLAAWSKGVRQAANARSAGKRERPRATSVDPRAQSIDALPRAERLLEVLPRVVIVGGKGGVGKTTVSCALALATARGGHRTGLVSTDPAPSIADALAQSITDVEREVDGGYGLRARQIDATEAFTRWRREYEERVDSAFDALLGPGLDAAHDRAIARRLLALAPPGIDELYALIWLGDAVAEGTFDRLVIDPAPTGHLIRLLEMPALALDWTHRLLRLILKYRELAGGGALSGELLAFARRSRAVASLLQSREQSGVVVVSLDESIVRTETLRVIDRVRVIGCNVPALIWNRVRVPPAPLPAEPPIGQFLAAAVDPQPIGVAELLRWFDDWRVLGRDA